MRRALGDSGYPVLDKQYWQRWKAGRVMSGDKRKYGVRHSRPEVRTRRRGSFCCEGPSLQLAPRLIVLAILLACES